jgi:uncharacterized membrane protein
MKISRQELKSEAKKLLEGNWKISILVVLIFVLISFGIKSLHIIGSIIGIFLSPVITIGLMTFFLKISRNKKVEIGTLFSKFSLFWKVIGLNFMVGLFSTLWSLLLIIPGIIASLSYSMVFYILIDNPEIKILEAIKESKRITNGYKMDILILNLSFIGWALLSCLTLGIGFLFLTPYIQTTTAILYTKLKNNSSVTKNKN